MLMCRVTCYSISGARFPPSTVEPQMLPLDTETDPAPSRAGAAAHEQLWAAVRQQCSKGRQVFGVWDLEFTWGFGVWGSKWSNVTGLAGSVEE